MSEEALGAWYRAWEDVKREGQNAFAGVQNAYHDILVHGRLMSHGNPGRDYDYLLDPDVRAEYDQWKDNADKDTPDPEPEDLEPWS